MVNRAEFPLQWLGEHLIQQSILYEGNPDRTNIRERFQYKHDVPSTTPTTTTAKESVSASTANADNTTVTLPSAVNGNGNEEAGDAVVSSSGAEGSAPTNVNGIGEGEEEALKTEEVSRDTEMGGTT